MTKTEQQQVVLHLTSARPMIQHNARLANPTDPWTRELKALTGKRKKTDEDLIEIMRVEARGGIYETEAGLVGLPTANVWKAIHDAAKAFKLGKHIERAFGFEDTVQPLRVDGEEVMVDDFLTDPAHIDYRSVVIQRRRTMRARPIMRNWAATHKFTLATDELDLRDLAPVLERAGRLVGLCEWRPTYGTFEVEVEVAA